MNEDCLLIWSVRTGRSTLAKPIGWSAPFELFVEASIVSAVRDTFKPFENLRRLPVSGCVALSGPGPAQSSEPLPVSVNLERDTPGLRPRRRCSCGEPDAETWFAVHDGAFAALARLAQYYVR